MRFWVDKEQEKKPDGEWKDAYVFSINRKQYSTIFTNITNSWYRMDQMQIPAIYEDLFIIGLSIFALDKRVSRRRFKNCWTRDINVSIPVLEYDKWKDTGLQWEKMLGFLTGDHWHIVFRKSEVIYSYREHANRIHLNVQDCDCVCLFSGGLDSFCGAIRLLEEGGLLAWLDIMNILNLQKDRIYLSGLFRSFIQNNLLNLLVLQQIPELL